MVDYSKRLVEVDEILNYLNEEDLLKIPEDIRKIIKDNKDKEYVWKYDEEKELKDQNVSRDTIIILSYLNMEYLLNEEQKKYMKQIHELNEKKIENEKAEKYKIKDLFRENNSKQEQKDEIKQEVLVVVKENIFIKIINKIKKIFNK